MLNTETLEAQVLGTILKDPTVTKDVLQTLPLEIFKQPRHRNFYKMVQRLDQKNEEVNYTNLGTYFAEKLEHVGGISYLSQMEGSVASVADLQDATHKLFEIDAREKLLKLLDETIGKANDPLSGDFAEILDEFEQKSLQIRPKTTRENRAIDELSAWYEDIILKVQDPTRAFGILTRWGALDRMTLGFQRQNLIVVGARTSMGKSAFASEIKMRASRLGHKVASFSLEMSARQIYTRMAANLCTIPMQAIRTGNLTQHQIERLAACMDELQKIHIDDTRGVTAEYISSEMRRLKRHEGLDLVVIDYLQEIVEPHERSDNNGSGLHRVCQKIRKAAQDCDCAVIGLSQVKQEVDVRKDKRPFISDLFGSSAISAIADDIILLYRDEYYNQDTSDGGILEVNLAKQRNGPIGTIKLKYDKDYQKITSAGD